MQKKNRARRQTAHAPKLAPRTEQLLTVTLDAEASASVRRFAEEFGEDVRDVASGGILDVLPQALEEWEDTKQRKAEGKFAQLTYWQGAQEKVCDARKRRMKRAR